jgi:hypothetical protein
MKKVLFVFTVVIFAGCYRGSEPIPANDAPGKTEQIVILEEEAAPPPAEPVEVPVGERIAEKYLIRKLYNIEDIPDELYDRLCGSWGRFKSESNTIRTFSWGEAPHYSGDYLILDLGIKPPLLIKGNAEGTSTGYDNAIAEILSVGIIEENNYVLIFLTIDEDPEKLYFILTMNDDGTMDLNIHDRYYYNPEITHKHYKISGPGWEASPAREELSDETPSVEDIAIAEAKVFTERKPAAGEKLSKGDFSVFINNNSKWLSLGQNINEAIGEFDEIIRTDHGYYVDGLSIETIGEEIDYMLCSGQSDFITIRGIGLGSSSEDIAAAYGGTPGQSEYTYYFSTGDVLSTHILGFSMLNDKVEMIIFNISSP